MPEELFNKGVDSAMDFLTPQEVMEEAHDLRERYLKRYLSDQVLTQMFSYRVENPSEDGRIPVGRFGLHRRDDLFQVTGRQPLYGASRKDVLDTSFSGGQGGGALARVDLEPIVYNWFVTRFPALERIAKERANGVSHTWNISLDYGENDADFVIECAPGTVSRSTYQQMNTNIAILLIERGVSYKERVAVEQSGMTYNGGMDAVDLELQRGVWAAAKTFQRCLYQGTILSGKDGTSEFGRTYTNGFNGLRYMLGETSVVGNNAYYPGGHTPVIIDKGDGTITDAIDTAAQQILDNGGMPTAIHLSATAATLLRREASQLVRFGPADIDQGFVLGGHVRQIDTIAGRLDIVVVPGNSIGSYVAPSTSTYTGTNVEDVYVLDESVLSFPFLGSANPTTLEIPMGYDKSNCRLAA